MLDNRLQTETLDTAPYVEFGDRHLTFREDTPYEVWEAVLSHLKSAEKSIQWWLGDALRFGERKYGEMYSQALEATDYSYGTLRNAAWVSGKIELSRRHDNLSFAHHQAVAPLESHEQDELLLKAAPEDPSGSPRMSAREVREEVQVLKTLPPENIHFSSESKEWYTPPEFIDRVLAVLGRIDLDPCAEPGRSIPAAKHITEEQNGLLKEWRGRVFMNPPYGRGESGIVPFVEKLVAEHQVGRVAEAIALVPARTDTRWFRAFRDYPKCFVSGRLRFGGHDSGAPFPSCAVYVGSNRKAFVEQFSALGDVYELATVSPERVD